MKDFYSTESIMKVRISMVNRKKGKIITSIKNKGIKRNPYLLFFPFLILYIILILIFAKNENFGDEIRYITYAENLTHGFYSPPYPYIDLGNGPGYPLLISPLVALNAPLILIKLMNAIFLYFSIVFLFKALKQILPYKFSLIFSLIWAFYPNNYEQLFYTLPDLFAPCLIPVLIFAMIKAFKSGNKNITLKYLLLAGFTFGYLILTKPIFGYVLICLFISILILWIFNHKSISYKKSLLVLLVAFMVNVPYLGYTYQLTGKMFYWSSFGGNNLYWMSTPYPGEYGGYYRFPFTDRQDRIPGSEKQIQFYHQKDFDEILKNPEVKKANIKNGKIQFDLSNGIEQDKLLKKIAIQNIKSHPLKFIQNCISNAGRMLFNYPASYVLQKPSTLQRLPVNGTIIVFAIFCLIPTLINWKKIPFTLRFLLALSLVYFGGSLMGSAGTRMFTLIVPILLIWIAYILYNTVKVKLKLE